jgi:maltose alpha-D-glucosyltransferase/alpha-amylase
MRFWLDIGVDGFRLDAVPYLVEREGTNCENLAETHGVIRRFRQTIDAEYPDRMLLAEANQWPEEVRPYFGEGDECHMAYHFPLMPRLYMAVAQEDRHPVTDIMRQTPDIPDSCQWAIFLRNHDELTLEMVTDMERDYLWQFYASDARARLNLGIRRRLAPLLENDRRKVELLYGLLMSMPGTPVLYYGDEIGMGDNFFLGDRDGVRTPMQWTPDRNGGFSRVDPARLYLPPIMDPVYGYQARNVEAQTTDTSSLLNWLKRLIAVRRQHHVFGRGTIRFLYPGNRKVLVYLREGEGHSILCISNLSRAAQPVELDLSEFEERVPVELLSRSSFPPIGKLPYFITLAPYGFYWFLLARDVEAPRWHSSGEPPPPEFQTLVAPRGWSGLTDDAVARSLQRLLPDFLKNRRWFGAKEEKNLTFHLVDQVPLPAGPRDAAFALYDVGLSGDRKLVYDLPLALRWEKRGDPVPEGLAPWIISRIRQGPKVGVIYDATADDDFVTAVVTAMANKEVLPSPGGGQLRFLHGKDFELLKGDNPLTVTRQGREQSNTSLKVGEDMVLKFYRRLDWGIHPEIEIGRHLSDVAGFVNTPRTLGSAEYVGSDGKPAAVAILQRYVPNQGEGWSYVVDYLDRLLEQSEITPGPDLPTNDGPAEVDRALFSNLMGVLGRRTGEMHKALATETDDPAFEPEPVTGEDLALWKTRIENEAKLAGETVKKALPSLTAEARTEAGRLLEKQNALLPWIAEQLPSAIDADKIRFHGDYHLGQVIMVRNDFYIVDFEGEPRRPLSERREKRLPLTDVAGMLRSFDYAAWTAILKRLTLRPDAAETIYSAAQAWKQQAAQDFVTGYESVVLGQPFHPDDPAIARRILRLFMLEKACYEIGYEAAHRPDWLQIPVRGVLRLIEATEGDPWTA